MPRITREAVKEYLEGIYGRPVDVLGITEEGRQETGDELKGFGYGSPLFIDYEVDGKRKRAVIETMSASSFGHDHFSDRAQAVLWEHDAFNKLPGHVRSIDSGAFLHNGKMLSTGGAEEFFLVTEFVEGKGYFKDLERIRDTGRADDLDFERAKALSDYLVRIHSVKNSAPHLYTRRIRELMGHGECIMGIIDNYPKSCGFINQSLLKRIEFLCEEWRWKIKGLSHRLSQVHGDFHPWNILFREGTDFTLLDRSRGEWGEPADDVTSITMNYLFFSLLRSGRLEGPFERMFTLFWEGYLSQTDDREMLAVAAPFFAWRGLVVASPIWYPHIQEGVRKSVFNFIINVLESDVFDFKDVNRYLA